MPDGRKRTITIDRSLDTENLADSLSTQHGVLFEAEILTTGLVSFTAEKDVGSERQVLAIEVVSNGPEVPEAVDRLVAKAYLELHPKA